MSRGAVIEFVGLPGSGKTTLARLIAATLGDVGIDANTVVGSARTSVERTVAGRVIRLLMPVRIARLMLWWLFYAMGLWQSARLAWTDRGFAVWLGRYQIARPIPTRLKAHVCWWYAQLSGRHRVLKSRLGPTQVVMYDDGFLHRAVALFASPAESPDPADVARYAGSVPMPTVLIHVRADVDTCEHRVLSRGLWKHSRQLGRSELRRYLEEADRVLDMAIDSARQRGVPIVKADNGDDDPRSVARATALALEPLISRHFKSPRGM